MSGNEIIAELPRLAPGELVPIKNKPEEVLKDRGSPTIFPGVDSLFTACLHAATSASSTPSYFSGKIDATLYSGELLSKL